MKKLRKTTTARIEDALDIVADKIIDLELTAKRLEQIERNIKAELTRAENISLKVNLDELKKLHLSYKKEVEKLQKTHLIEIEKATKQLKNLYFYLYATIGATIVGFLVYQVT